MTASTEQELQDFEAWAVEEGLHIDRHKYGCEERYASISTQSALRGWQAARRSPVVAVPQGWKLVPVEPNKQMRYHAQKASMDHSPHGEWVKDEWPDVKRMWDAMLAAAPQPPEVEAAPVKMPEPWGKEFGDGVWYNLYTEHQVRQLLAQHGIK